MLGIKKDNIYIEDLREEFVQRSRCSAPMRCTRIYLLGTSIAPAHRQAPGRDRTRDEADARHGATGKGNDQVRFELTYYALEPSIKIIAWREGASRAAKTSWFARPTRSCQGRARRGAVLGRRQPPAPSSEGKVLEDPDVEPPSIVFQRTISPMEAPMATEVAACFERGDVVARRERLSPATLLARLNALGRDNGIGRVDLVENRFVGMKSRGVYETPAARSCGTRTAPSSRSRSTAAPCTLRTS